MLFQARGQQDIARWPDLPSALLRCQKTKQTQNQTKKKTKKQCRSPSACLRGRLFPVQNPGLFRIKRCGGIANMRREKNKVSSIWLSRKVNSDCVTKE